jgi:hypothetical protein
MAPIWIYIGIILLFCILIYMFLTRRRCDPIELDSSRIKTDTIAEFVSISPDIMPESVSISAEIIQETVFQSPETIPESVSLSEPDAIIHSIPHCIWTYWDTDTPPSLVTWCIESWKKHNPSYKIIVLNPSNLKQYLDTDVLSFPLANTPQRTSDFVRIHVLAQHGGIWADASLLMNAPLDWIHEPRADLVCYSIDRIHAINTPVLENWFLACVPKCDFMVKWRDEFVTINRFSGGEAYLDDLKKRSVNLDTIFCTAYLTMHAAAQYVLQKDNSSSVLRVLDAREGPYKHMRFNTRPLSFEESLGNLLSDPIQPIIKFRGIDRAYLKDHPDIEQQIKKHFSE